MSQRKPLALREATVAEREQLDLEEQQKTEELRAAAKLKKAQDRAALVVKLETKMQEKVKTENAQVNIRDIIAYQSGDLTGEFKGSKNKSESGPDSVTRMVAHIKDLADKAKEVHLKENFKTGVDITRDDIPVNRLFEIQDEAKMLAENDPFNDDMDIKIKRYEDELIAKEYALKSDKKNEITRLMTHEFSFFPDKDRGPLTAADFKSLLAQIGKLAEQYPNNLHLMLGSFPVLIEGTTQVQNMVVFAQCGVNSRINVFAKVMPSHVDAVYPNTTNPSYSPDVASPSQVEVMGNFHWQQNPPNSGNWTNRYRYMFAFTDAGIQGYVNTSLGGDINKLVEECAGIKNIDEAVLQISNKPFGTEIETQNVLLALKSIQDAVNTNDYAKLRVGVGNLEATIGQFTNYWQNKQNASINENLSSLVLGGADAPVHYGGNIICQTAGKATFRVGADICLDHMKGVAQQIIKQDISDVNRRGEGMIPEHGSHVVMSNIIDIDQSKITSKTITHADPHHSGETDYFNPGSPAKSREAIRTESGGKIITEQATTADTVTMSSPAFGSSTTVDVYTPRPLTELSGELAVTTKSHNNFMIKLEALRHSRQESDYSDCSKEIAEHIVKYITGNIKDLGDQIKFSGLILITAKDISPQERCSEIIKELDKIDPKGLTSNEAKFAIEIGKSLLSRELADLKPFIERAESVKHQSLSK